MGVELAGEYQIVLNTDDKIFDGQGRIDPAGRYFTTDFRWNDRSNFLQGKKCAKQWSELTFLVYIPSRVALVLAKVG